MAGGGQSQISKDQLRLMELTRANLLKNTVYDKLGFNLIAGGRMLQKGSLGKSDGT